MTSDSVSRRQLLLRGCSLAAMLVTLASCSKTSSSHASCRAPEQMSESERSLRTSLVYTDQSADPQQACRGCAYFQATASESECGSCQIVGGAVSATGHCTSWSPKA